MSVSEWPLHPRGHALECRITSEDPANGFLPSAGKIGELHPPSGPGVRWDAGVEAGYEVTLHYDSLLAKLIVHAENRAAAIHRMLRALDELVITGVATNQGFFRRLLNDPDFAQGEVDIQFLERRPDLLASAPDAERDLRIAIAAALAEHDSRTVGRSDGRTVAGSAGKPGEGEPGSPWAEAGRLDALR